MSDVSCAGLPKCQCLMMGKSLSFSLYLSLPGLMGQKDFLADQH